MTTQITAPIPQLPAHLRAMKLKANIRTGVSVPTLSFKNKVWQVREGSNTTAVTHVIDGEVQPAHFVDVIIVAKNPERSRLYYEGPFDPDNNVPPTCAASDGIRPDKDIKTPQAETCAVCPNSVKGSAMSQDKTIATTRCKQVQRLVVVPALDLNSSPLLLSVRGQALYDPDNQINEKDGRYALSQYENMLSKGGATSLAQAVTRISFDSRPEIDGPKLLFKLKSWIAEDISSKVEELANSEEVDNLVSGKLVMRAAVDTNEAFAPAPEEAKAPVTAPEEAKAPPPAEIKSKPARQPRPTVTAAESTPVKKEVAADTEAEMNEKIERLVAERMARLRGNGEVLSSAEPTAQVPDPAGDDLDKMLGDWAKL